MRSLQKAACWLTILAAAAAADGLHQITQTEALALVVTRIQPEFPEMAKQLKLSGAVEVEVVIGENGAVESAKPVSGNPVLTRSAVDALKRWKFKPFQQDGAAIKVETTLKISFAK
jgi:TonB family protein